MGIGVQIQLNFRSHALCNAIKSGAIRCNSFPAANPYCSLFDFYIKPQPQQVSSAQNCRCSLFDFYIKPQLLLTLISTPNGCSLFDFYIKPQPLCYVSVINLVVPYSISTSNHNAVQILCKCVWVVPYSISTSNHNLFLIISCAILLFLIRFLHQTTTDSQCIKGERSCSLFDFYIKPQRRAYC